MAANDTPDLPRAPAPDPSAFAATDQCVLCGLCLPHCPTYALSCHEADSPRGRISLIQAMARGELAPDAAMQNHLDGCLVCRACEDVCPSQVPYGQLIDAARAELRRRGRRADWQDKAMRSFAADRDLRRALYAGLRLSRVTGLSRRLARGLPQALRRPLELAMRLPAAPLRFDAEPVAEDGRPSVGLFTGCAGEVFDRQTLDAARRLLHALGYRVIAPPAQTCCGALHRHAGDPAQAAAFARDNLAAFPPDAPVLATSSACAASLREYALWLGESAQTFAQRAHEIVAFLDASPWPERLALRPLAARVALHTPCTQRRVLHAPDAARRLLARIPDINLIDLPGNDRCCGAAGAYMLEHPATADALLTPKLDALAAARPDLLVTTNIGCALHLARGLQERGLEIEILHPVTLLTRQLAETPVAS